VIIKDPKSGNAYTLSKQFSQVSLEKTDLLTKNEFLQSQLKSQTQRLFLLEKKAEEADSQKEAINLLRIGFEYKMQRKKSKNKSLKKEKEEILNKLANFIDKDSKNKQLNMQKNLEIDKEQFKFEEKEKELKEINEKLQEEIMVLNCEIAYLKEEGEMMKNSLKEMKKKLEEEFLKNKKNGKLIQGFTKQRTLLRRSSTFEKEDSGEEVAINNMEGRLVVGKKTEEIVKIFSLEKYENYEENPKKNEIKNMEKKEDIEKKEEQNMIKKEEKNTEKKITQENFEKKMVKKSPSKKSVFTKQNSFKMLKIAKEELFLTKESKRFLNKKEFQIQKIDEEEVSKKNSMEKTAVVSVYQNNQKEGSFEKVEENQEKTRFEKKKMVFLMKKLEKSEERENILEILEKIMSKEIDIEELLLIKTNYERLRENQSKSLLYKEDSKKNMLYKRDSIENVPNLSKNKKNSNENKLNSKENKLNLKENKENSLKILRKNSKDNSIDNKSNSTEKQVFPQEILSKDSLKSMKKVEILMKTPQTLNFSPKVDNFEQIFYEEFLKFKEENGLDDLKRLIKQRILCETHKIPTNEQISLVNEPKNPIKAPFPRSSKKILSSLFELNFVNPLEKQLFSKNSTSLGFSNENMFLYRKLRTENGPRTSKSIGNSVFFKPLAINEGKFKRKSSIDEVFIKEFNENVLESSKNEKYNRKSSINEFFNEKKMENEENLRFKRKSSKTELFPNKNFKNKEIEENIENFSKKKSFFKYPFRSIHNKYEGGEDLEYSFDAFEKIYRNLLKKHEKCGPFCEHLKRFYKRIGFVGRLYHKEELILHKNLIDKLNFQTEV